jgi:hypothetical protein
MFLDCMHVLLNSKFFFWIDNFSVRGCIIGFLGFRFGMKNLVVWSTNR